MQFDQLKRREFITLLGGASAWPRVARAQLAERVRHVGVLMTAAADDSESLARVGAFLQGLQQLGWTDGRNVRLEYRWGAGDAERIRKYAAELVALVPDVILVTGTSGMTRSWALRSVRLTRAMPARSSVRSQISRAPRTAASLCHRTRRQSDTAS